MTNFNLTETTIGELKPGDKFLYQEYDKQQEFEFIKIESLPQGYKRFWCKYITDNFNTHFASSTTKVMLITNISNDDKRKIEGIVNNSPDKKLKIHLGCFNKPIPHFVNVDVRPYPETLCDIVDDVLKLEKFDDNSTDTILCVHCLEHVGRNEYMDALKVWYNKLRSGGEVYISVPDMQAVCEHYIYHRDLYFLYSFIWGSQRHKADFHGCGFDFELLKKSLEEVGFKNVELYDWTKTSWAYIDSYAGAYAKHLDRSSRLMSLNIKATKP